MCLVLPSRVLARVGDEAEIEMHGGLRSTVRCTLQPDAAVGDHVLVDRGQVLEIITEEEAAAIIAMYEEIGDLLSAADGLEDPTPLAEEAVPWRR